MDTAWPIQMVAMTASQRLGSGWPAALRVMADSVMGESSFKVDVFVGRATGVGRCAFQCGVANAAAPAISVGKRGATGSCDEVRRAWACRLLKYVIHRNRAPWLVPVRTVYWRVWALSSTNVRFWGSKPRSARAATDRCGWDTAGRLRAMRRQPAAAKRMFRSTRVDMPATVPALVYCHMTKSNCPVGTAMSYSANHTGRPSRSSPPNRAMSRLLP